MKFNVCEICNESITERNHWQKRHQPAKRPDHSEKLKTRYDDGELIPWNRGHTRETHSSVQQISKSLKEYYQHHKGNTGMLHKNHSIETRRKMSQSKIGQKNNNWRGGVTEGIRLFRKSRRYQQWRRTVLRRDNHTCLLYTSPSPRD